MRTADTGSGEFNSDKSTTDKMQSEQQGQQQGSSSGQPTATESGSDGSSSQGEFTGQTETSVADRTGQQSGVEGTGGQAGDTGSGFVGSQGGESPDYLKQDKQSFAQQGQGATSEEEDSDDNETPGGTV